MKRAVITGRGKIELVNVAVPRPGPDEARIRVCRSGVCGSDVLEYLHPEGFSKCLGHEFAGVVTQTGSKVQGVKKGDRVVVYCYSANGFAEYITVRSGRIVVLPKQLSMEQGALVEPTAVALTGLRYCGFRTGDTCFVSGCGAIGLLIIQLLRAFGARRIVAAEPNSVRRAKARLLGADVVIDPQRQSVEKAVIEAAGNKVDFAVECAGAGASLLACARVVARGHTICTLGLTPTPLGVSSYQLFTTNVGFHAATPFDIRMYEVAARLMADKTIDPRAIVTHSFPLARIADAFELAASPGTKAIKIIIRCSKD
jgi:threonine dehydrogenase-like Zn-dependent dehydrogenase